MSRRRKKKGSSDEVELNLAAMLDMAFQLLSFFILTFRPAPVEGQVALRLPPPQAVAVQNPTNTPPGGQTDKDTPPGLNTLTISVFADTASRRVGYRVGEGDVSGLTALDNRLKEIFADTGNPFDQVIIQASSNLLYEQLMEVVEICTHQTLPGGQKLSKLSFVEVPVE